MNTLDKNNIMQVGSEKETATTIQYHFNQQITAIVV